MMKYPILSLSASCLVLIACSNSDKSKESSNKRDPFDRAAFTELTPLTDGSVYAKSADGQLWYIRGNRAVHIVSLTESVKLPEVFDITPALDGSAYLSNGIDGGLWHLRGEAVEKVLEVPSFASRTGERNSEYRFYALYLAEHKKRKEAEYRAENPPDRSDEDESDYPY